MKDTFRNIINFYALHDIEFDAVIGDVDMPATFVFNGIPTFTDYCEKKYGELLNSKAEIFTNPNYTDCVIVNYDDAEFGEKFCMAMAGYCSETEYEKLFGKESD